jgi:hypothetical protein
MLNPPILILSDESTTGTHHVFKECCVCGDKNTIGHHYLGYDREHWLDIKWLCDKHHIQEHERMRQAGENKLL